MDNFVSEGNSIELIAPVGGVTVSVPVKIGNIVAVPHATAAQGEKFSGVVHGVLDLPKVAAEPWTAGMLVYWNTGSSLASSVSTASMKIGVAVSGAANPSATGRVLLGYFSG